jgi:DNA-binding GntR family transcriptional regulator
VRVDGIDDSSPHWPYEQVARDLRELIAGMPPHALLPSIRSLCQRYGISEKTAQHAYRVLEADGLVYVKQKRGHFTAGP